jgi:hypothetical protein
MSWRVNAPEVRIHEESMILLGAGYNEIGVLKSERSTARRSTFPEFKKKSYPGIPCVVQITSNNIQRCVD